MRPGGAKALSGRFFGLHSRVPTAAPLTQPKLTLSGISKSFPGVKALDDVSLDLRAGSVHALMGENGAGKSTLMKCLFGIYSTDQGEILLNGQKV